MLNYHDKDVQSDVWGKETYRNINMTIGLSGLDFSLYWCEKSYLVPENAS